MKTTSKIFCSSTLCSKGRTMGQYFDFIKLGKSFNRKVITCKCGRPAFKLTRFQTERGGKYREQNKVSRI